MITKIITLLTLLFTFITVVNAQNVQGKVFGKGDPDNEILPGATVKWINTDTGTLTNSNGVFTLSEKNIKDKRVVAIYIGYKSDTIDVGDEVYLTIFLEPDAINTGNITITGKRPTAYISQSDVAKTEIITQKELTKAACCDLAGCFGTQSTIQPQTTNVITDSKELRILGLSGVYNQVLIDGMPMIQGLSYTYGISSFPGTLIDKINVSKGSNSVLQGFENLSGQINVETKQPDNTEALLLNIYANSFMEKQFNANYSTSIGNEKQWNTTIAFHSTQPANKNDKDGDNFINVPLITRYMLFNKWKYGNNNQDGLLTIIGLRYLNEKRVGGQTNYESEKDQGSSTVYGQTVKYNQTDFYTKTGFRLNDDNALVLFANSYYQYQNSFFGTVKYDAKQINGYMNLQHELLWEEKHLLKYGVSFRFSNLDENISFMSDTLLRTYSGLYNTKQIIPGMFAENAFHWDNDKYIWIIGIRYDHHNSNGSYFTPRTMLKYAIDENNIVRASIGTGWRQVNLFSENIGILISSRDIIFTEKLNPEQGLNWGLSYTNYFDFESIQGSISTDFYQTRFFNQFFPDYDTDPSKIIIRNFTDLSISNSFQIEANLNFLDEFEFRTSYNYLDVYRIENGNKFVLPFNSKNRIMAAISYRPGNSFYFDLNLNWYDRQRLPNTSSNPYEFQVPDYSKPYTLVNGQVTYIVDDFEIYAGCENVFDFRQNKPIINWQNPFGKYFDTSFVWGPTKGREIYLGIRFKIFKDEKL